MKLGFLHVLLVLLVLLVVLLVLVLRAVADRSSLSGLNSPMPPELGPSAAWW